MILTKSIEIYTEINLFLINKKPTGNLLIDRQVEKLCEYTESKQEVFTQSLLEDTQMETRHLYQVISEVLQDGVNSASIDLFYWKLSQILGVSFFLCVFLSILFVGSFILDFVFRLSRFLVRYSSAKVVYDESKREKELESTHEKVYSPATRKNSQGFE